MFYGNAYFVALRIAFEWPKASCVVVILTIHAAAPSIAIIIYKFGWQRIRAGI